MKIVIDIPDDDYEYIKLLHEGLTDYQTTLKLYRAVKNGTVEERSQGERWIPISERLPNEMEQVLVWFEYYRYGDYNCFYPTYGFCHVFDGKWSHFINGETGWEKGRIIAWTPLPEPYKEAENDYIR